MGEMESKKELYRKNKKTLRSNLKYRIILLILDFLLLMGLIYSFGFLIRSIPNLALQIFILINLVVYAYVPFAYFWRSLIQINSEFSLNRYILNVREDIENLNQKKDEEKYTRYLQMDINRVRFNLKILVESSEIVSPPIYNYELDRLQKRIDIFFNTISEVLFPSYGIFSEEARIESEHYESMIPPEQMGEEEAGREPFTGKIIAFDRYALDEFMMYLGKALFEPVRPYSPFSYRHPINLIRISRFFTEWNSIIASCLNCKGIFAKVEGDVTKYYEEIGRMETQRKQRMRSLTDSTLIVIVSVVLSTVVGYLIQLASG
jgi:hypothetical protein